MAPRRPRGARRAGGRSSSPRTSNSHSWSRGPADPFARSVTNDALFPTCADAAVSVYFGLRIVWRANFDDDDPARPFQPAPKRRARAGGAATDDRAAPPQDVDARRRAEHDVGEPGGRDVAAPRTRHAERRSRATVRDDGAGTHGAGRFPHPRWLPAATRGSR